MAVAIMTEYRPLPGRRAEFFNLLQAEREHANSLGGVFAAREVTSGGASTGNVTVVIAFATALQRGEYTDHTTGSAPSPADDALFAADPCAALVTRYSANGIPASVTPQAILAAIVSPLYLRIAPGRHPDAEVAIYEHRRDREELGIECEQWALISAGAEHGLRIFATTAANFAELAMQQERINALSASRGLSVGALTRAQQNGTLTVVESRTSRRITEL